MLTFPALALFCFSLLSGLVCASSSPSHDVGQRRRHSVNSFGSGVHNLEKRYDNARLTWYDDTTGQTACGGWYNNGDWVSFLVFTYL